MKCLLPLLLIVAQLCVVHLARCDDASEREALRAFERLKLNTIRDSVRPNSPVIGAAVSDLSEVQDADMESLRLCPQLEWIDLSNSPRLTDRGLQQLRSLVALSHVGLEGTSTTDTGIHEPFSPVK